MPTFRDCCRHPRASSPDLPNTQLVPRPTQGEVYDADAVRISTPTEVLVESLRLSRDEPRPSSDTVLHYKPHWRSSNRLKDDSDQGGSPRKPTTLSVPRVNSIALSRRRSHTQSQPSPSTSIAALEHYINITPSRAALRKRLKSVNIIDGAEMPPSPTLALSRITNLPESAGLSHWRLSCNESSLSFRRFGLRGLGTNELHVGSLCEREADFAPEEAQIEPAEVRPDTLLPRLSVSGKSDSSPNNEILPATRAVVHRHSIKHALAMSGERSMPGSYQSESTAASIHLYDMQISERVASSNSNVAAPEDLRRHRASMTGSLSMASRGPKGYHGSRESSSLQSPKESSSVYSSSEDDLTSSRKSSMLLIQGLPQRIERLKSRAIAEELYATSAQQSQITVIPRSRYPTTLKDEDRQRGRSSNETNGWRANSEDENAPGLMPRSPLLRRSSTEPRLNRFRRDGAASFDGSGEWHLSPPSRQPTGLLHRQSTGLISRQPTSFLTPQKEVSVWEKALREHAQEDSTIARARVGSMSYEIGRDDFKRRARSRRFTRTPSPLQGITEDPWSQSRGNAKETAPGRASPTQTWSGRGSSTSPSSRERKDLDKALTSQASSSARSVDSWTRYPSYTFAERTAIGNNNDKITTRDFAIGHNPQRRISKKESRHMTFGRKLLHKVGRLYKTRSSDFRRYNAGHRSSISVGGVLEYPELEIPRMSFEPVLLSGPRVDDGTESTAEHEEPLQEGITTPIHLPVHQPAEKTGSQRSIGKPELNPVQWERSYDDCVARPRNTSTEDEEIAPDETGPKGNDNESLELDEVQQAEVDRARDEALNAADDCLRRSLDVRYPRRL
ncbi:MAG: hypothetical protein LQ345_006037 [Seirophora villosa]|nr:MAG: hypothetical protein LQ345_006037 [Seirophora villosa]